MPDKLIQTLMVADEIVRELATRRVDVVLFETSFSDKVSHSWPGTPLAAVAQDPVADYIARTYRPAESSRLRRSGSFCLWFAGT